MGCMGLKSRLSEISPNISKVFGLSLVHAEAGNVKLPIARTVRLRLLEKVVITFLHASNLPATVLTYDSLCGSCRRNRLCPYR